MYITHITHTNTRITHTHTHTLIHTRTHTQVNKQPRRSTTESLAQRMNNNLDDANKENPFGGVSPLNSPRMLTGRKAEDSDEDELLF